MYILKKGKIYKKGRTVGDSTGQFPNGDVKEEVIKMGQGKEYLVQ
jgi:hypothetical protein